jgi:hypothetical protein
MAAGTHQSIESQQDTLGSHFFDLGEIRVATDSDFDYFIRLAERHEDWVKMLDKKGLTVWQKEMGHSTIKMAKVSVDREIHHISHENYTFGHCNEIHCFSYLLEWCGHYHY